MMYGPLFKLMEARITFILLLLFAFVTCGPSSPSSEDETAAIRKAIVSYLQSKHIKTDKMTFALSGVVLKDQRATCKVAFKLTDQTLNQNLPPIEYEYLLTKVSGEWQVEQPN